MNLSVPLFISDSFAIALSCRNVGSTSGGSDVGTDIVAYILIAIKKGLTMNALLTKPYQTPADKIRNDGVQVVFGD